MCEREGEGEMLLQNHAVSICRREPRQFVKWKKSMQSGGGPLDNSKLLRKAFLHLLKPTRSLRSEWLPLDQQLLVLNGKQWFPGTDGASPSKRDRDGQIGGSAVLGSQLRLATDMVHGSERSHFWFQLKQKPLSTAGGAINVCQVLGEMQMRFL